MKTKNKVNKDIAVELLRVLAIFMVIGTHLKTGYIINGNFMIDRAFLTCLVADGVAVFWLIMGFFFFKKQSYLERLKKLFKRIILPLVLATLLYFFFFEFVCGIKNFNDSINHTSAEYIFLLKEGLLKWKNVVVHSEHLWYLYVYVIVVILAPILENIKTLLDKINSKYIVYFILLILFLNDVNNNEIFKFSHYLFHGAIGAFIFLILGDILYRNKECLKEDKFLPILGLITFILINLFRTFILYNDQTTSEPIFWYTSFSVISTLSLFTFTFGLSENLGKNKVVNKTITHLGPLVLYIYIIHMMVIGILYKRGASNVISNIFGNVKIGQMLYYLTMVLVVFCLSLLVSEIYVFLKKQLLMCLKRKVNN